MHEMKQLRMGSGIKAGAAVAVLKSIEPKMRGALFSELENGIGCFTAPQLSILLPMYKAPSGALRTCPEYAYSFGEDKRVKKPDKRANPCRLQTRTDIETDFAFRALCYEEGKTVSDKLLELVRAAVGGMEGTA